MGADPNLFAIVMLVAWPAIAMCLYSMRPVNQATIWTILGGYLLLPVGAMIKFEMIPAFDKNTIPALAALVGCVVVTRRVPRLMQGFGLADILIIMLLVGPFITSELNGDTVVIGDIVLPGVGHYDAASAAISQLMLLLPFILGRQFIRSSQDHADIPRILVIAGLAYSLPMLFEVRMTPQLHTWIYGYFPHSFFQQLRDGGFRPVVFLGHGLLVAFFAMTTAVAAAALWRTQTTINRLPPAGVTAYLSVILILCRSLGSLVYGVVLIPLVRLATPRFQLRVAGVLVAVALLYPMLRTMDVFPTSLILEAAHSVSAERAESLNKRFEQEKMLLEHASERLLFGWGRFGRSRVLHESGQDISVTDGYWIITVGTSGLFGFLATFALLAWPIFRAALTVKLTESAQDGVFLAALGLILAIGTVDLLPNASVSPWTWLLAGALLGRTESLSLERNRASRGGGGKERFNLP